MTTKETTRRLIGVWIDHEKAFVVTLSGDEASTQTFQSDVESKHKSTGGVRSGSPYASRSIESAKNQSAHRDGQIQRFYAEVAAALPGADELVVLGPSVAKDEFSTFLADNRRQDVPPVKAITTVPSHMTLPQISAYVREMFGRQAPRRRVGEHP